MKPARAPILVLAHVIIDDVILADGISLSGIPGGAALYAATGASLWWPEVAIVTGVGTDLHQATRGCLRQHRLREEGLLVRDAHTIRSRLVYRPDGERHETAVYGDAHFRRMETDIWNIPSALLPAAATYLFRNTDRIFWDGVNERRPALGTILWELHGEVAYPRFWPDVRRIMPQVDIVSLNLQEGRRLLDERSVDAIADRLLEAGARHLLLRMGADGAVVASPTQRLWLQPPESTIHDVTGAGNSFCGGFLAGWCKRPEDTDFAARCGAAAAACAMAQFGPAPPCDRNTLEALADAAVIEPATGRIMH